jgi:hypothetical protein
MTLTLAPQPDSVSMFAELSSTQLTADRPKTDWLLEGYLAPGCVTLVTGDWKGAGKTTLVAVLLKHLEAGGRLAGQAVRAGKALVISEEARFLWGLRQAKYHFGDNVRFICQPFQGRTPTRAEWEQLIEHVLESCRRQGIQLVVFDTLARMLPGGDQSNAGRMLQALALLERLTAAGLAVLLLHHPRKAASIEGHWARNSGALLGFVHINVEMHLISRASAADRRRKLLGFSKFEETPRRLVIELNEAGTDYLLRTNVTDDDTDEELARWWPTLQAQLADTMRKETRDNILRFWPVDQEKPSAATLYRWLEQAVGRGLVCRDGEGVRDKPFRYWLKGQEALWQDDILATARRQELEDQGQPESIAWEEIGARLREQEAADAAKSGETGAAATGEPGASATGGGEPGVSKGPEGEEAPTKKEAPRTGKWWYVDPPKPEALQEPTAPPPEKPAKGYSQMMYERLMEQGDGPPLANRGEEPPVPP